MNGNISRFLNWKYFSLICAVLTVCVAWSFYLEHFNEVGQGDWPTYYDRYEVARKSILEYGQFPFWHPWKVGGLPLFAHPELGVFSIEMAFVLLLGTVNGLSLSVFIYVLFGTVGMWLFIGDYTENSITRFWGSVLFALQGSVSLYIVVGHLGQLDFFFLPWFLFCVKRVKSSLLFSVLLGVLMAIDLNGVINYGEVMVFVCVAVAFINESFRNYRKLDFWRNLIQSFLVLVSLSAFRLILTFSFFSQFPREVDLRASIGFPMFLKALIYPGQDPGSFEGPLKYYWGWHEMGAYIGLIAVIMFLVSFKRETRWWHWMAGLTLILALNSASLIMPGYWLRELPLFKTMVTITRWRLLTVFFVIIGACRGFDFILDKFAFRRWAYLLVGVSLCGLVYNQFYQWSHEKWPSGEDFLNSIPIRSETILSSSNPAFKPFAASARNIALIRTNETLLGYSNDFPSKRISIENPAYKGEILGLKKQILKENIRWTQNKIFIKSDEENLLFVNQNPGNYWRLDGECLYPDYRAFETDKYFIVKLSPGSHVISASPPELSSVCVVVLALFLITGLYSYLSFAGKKKKSCS